jgi:ubiquinol-cytochrome c reductase cytochrome c subunit
MMLRAEPGVPAAATTSPSATAPPGAAGVPASVLYRQECAACHGDDGRGTSRGPSLAGVGEAAVDFQLSTGRMPKKDASAKLPPYSPVLPPADIRSLDQYVTALVASGGPGIPAVDPVSGDVAHGEQLFDENCAACHGWAGAGGIMFDRPVPKITEATPTKVGEAVRSGPAEMPLFGPRQISTAELNDLDAYIQSLKHPADQGGDPISHLGPVAEGMVGWLIAMVGLLLVIRWIGERG